jgi:geranylgeranyl diphosphate synthase type I
MGGSPSDKRWRYPVHPGADSAAPLGETVSADIALRSASILQETCLALTQGQYMDLSYETRGDLTLEAYWPMVSGKTAALLAACTQLGALAARASDPVCRAYYRFGRFLGLASRRWTICWVSGGMRR